MEFYGDAFFLANDDAIYLLSPYTESETLDCKKIEFKSTFLEFKLIDELLFVNTHKEILTFDLYDIIAEDTYWNFQPIDKLPKICETVSAVERMAVSKDRQKIFIYNHISNLDIYLATMGENAI